jgi:hypothetical protein
MSPGAGRWQLNRDHGDISLEKSFAALALSQDFQPVIGISRRLEYNHNRASKRGQHADQHPRIDRRRK